ncbi:MAG: hypothetical protein ACOZF0_18500 [Thermodesulfobacteriota bacterium]
MRHLGIRIGSLGNRGAWGRVLAVAVALFCLAGCYAAMAERDARTLTGDLETEENSVLQTIWVLEFSNKSFLADREVETTMQRMLLDECAANCHPISFQEDREGNRLDIPRLSSGEIDNYGLALASRGKGAGAVLSGVITDIRGEEESLGFWWFEEKVRSAVVNLNIVLLDSETGAKLLDDNYNAESEITARQYKRLKAGDRSLELPLIADAMKQVAADAGEALCETLRTHPAKFFPAGMSGNSLRLTAGRNAGLEKGIELDAYQHGDVMTGKDGQRFAIPGTRTGTVRILSVTESEAAAEIISGTVPDASVCLKPKVDWE